VPKLRPIISQADAALAFSEDFAKAARDLGDMPNYYRWRDVAKQWRLVANASSGAAFLPFRIDWTSMPRPAFRLSS